jgi:hypothetical protein
MSRVTAGIDKMKPGVRTGVGVFETPTALVFEHQSQQRRTAGARTPTYTRLGARAQVW